MDRKILMKEEKERKQVVVVVSGGFDPFHEGHLDHIVEASKLGDYLIVLVSSDNDMLVKKGKFNVPLWFRIKTVQLWMKEYDINGKVIMTMDTNGTQVNSLKILRPDIYAEGGDVTPDTINKEEERVCKEIGCKIVYEVGHSYHIPKINSSSKMVAIENK